MSEQNSGSDPWREAVIEEVRRHNQCAELQRRQIADAFLIATRPLRPPPADLRFVEYTTPGGVLFQGVRGAGDDLSWRLSFNGVTVSTDDGLTIEIGDCRVSAYGYEWDIEKQIPDEPDLSTNTSLTKYGR